MRGVERSGLLRCRRRPFVMVGGLVIGIGWLVSGVGSALFAGAVGGLVMALAGLCCVVGALAHVEVSGSGVSVVYLVRLRHWEWSRITDITVDPDPDPRPLLGVLVAGWVPCLMLGTGERVPLDILAVRSKRSAEEVVGALRARLDEASVQPRSQAAAGGLLDAESR